MYPKLLLVSLTCLLLFSCSKEQDLFFEGSNEEKNYTALIVNDDYDEPEVRPFKSKSSGIVEVTETAEICGGGPFWKVYGHGNATHFGKFSINFEFCYGNAPIGHIVTANGDEVTVVLYYEMVNGEFVQKASIIGGTGRFINATGNWTNTGPVDPVQGYFEHSSEGWIKY